MTFTGSVNGSAFPQAATLQPFAAAHEEYLAALRQLGAPVDAEQRATSAYASYVEAVQGAAPDEEAERRLAEALAAYGHAVEEALADDGVRNRFDTAYREYCKAIKEAWVNVDVETLDVAAVAAISSSMTSVAWTAATGTPAV